MNEGMNDRTSTFILVNTLQSGRKNERTNNHRNEKGRDQGNTVRMEARKKTRV